MTESEKILWFQLKSKKLDWVKFLRQYSLYVFTENIWLDRYIIPDFLSREYKIIIELDWSIHNLKEIYELDNYKENLLKDMWYKVLRFKNEEIYTNLNNVLIKIAASFSW
jgi:very-short-patch-repair endonuclease